MKKVKFLRVPQGAKCPGVFSARTGGGYVLPGDPCTPNEGGGFIGSIEFEGGFLHFRKVDAEGKPLRAFGTVSAHGGRQVAVTGDAVSVSAAGFTMVYDEVPDEVQKPVEADPPPAKPVQQQQRR